MTLETIKGEYNSELWSMVWFDDDGKTGTDKSMLSGEVSQMRKFIVENRKHVNS